MSQDFNLLINEAIQLELNVGQLYILFNTLLPEDSEFWWKLAMEEENHAALLKTAYQMNATRVEIPEGILPNRITELKESNHLILKSIKDFKKHPDRTKAFQLAYQIELSAGELHYDNFMKTAPDSRVTKIFKKLNGDDVNHAERIRKYMVQHQIS